MEKVNSAWKKKKGKYMPIISKDAKSKPVSI